jgi:riboflavin synthase
MFTGIVRHVGVVRTSRPAKAGRLLAVDLGGCAEALGLGDSVAVSGVCLTVTGLNGTEADFDVVPQTLSGTTLGLLRAGARVNLERALKAAGSLDGHLVQGHVDGVAEVQAIRTSGEYVVALACPAELAGQMVPKGSVCLDGVSLTLVDVGPHGFSVALIPATLEGTTLGSWKVGSKVNVETDLIGKYVRRCLAGLPRRTEGKPGTPPSDGLTLEKLKEAGFA